VKIKACSYLHIFLPWKNENGSDNNSVNLLLEENHYSVNGKKHCSFSEGQDINHEKYSDFWA
jgi:hypothetical protein